MSIFPKYILLSLLFLSAISCGVSKSVHNKPQLLGYNNEVPIVQKQSETVFYTKHNFLLKNQQNLWEMYIEGDPLERGLAMGSLTDSLLKNQQKYFFKKIDDFLPSKFKQNMMTHFLKWYGRKLYLNIPEEYKTEIYGVSQYTSADYNYFATPYLRGLYLHSAHDLGHAFQDLDLVECSSFAVWGEKSEDGNLLLGRNLDFHAGDDFAKDKIIAFIKPDQGHPFMMVTWAGMIGVVSGMNTKGLTVSINSAKSDPPLVAKTPISILTREILQYASTIEEAITIAKKRTVFVSESILVGSAIDGKAVLIEVTPKDLAVYEVENGNQIISTNHFQSAEFMDDKNNLAQIKNSHSKYRYDRLAQLLSENEKINMPIATEILRNKEGIDNIALGYGNEKAINQLIAHHGIIFKPDELLVWISANPYQMGEFVCYDLNSVFAERDLNAPIVSLQEENLNIPKDDFIATTAYANYEKFRIEDKKLDTFLKEKKDLPLGFAEHYQSLNPDYWVVYYKIGKYFYQKKYYQLAKIQFEKALTKEITTLPQKGETEKYLKKIKRKLR
jgi:predicted choloylglycine hydrolase